MGKRGRPKADQTQVRVQAYIDEAELAILEEIARTLGGLSAAARLAIVYGAPIALERLKKQSKREKPQADAVHP